MSESFEQNSRFERFGEDLRLSLNDSTSSSNAHASPNANVVNNVSPPLSATPRSQSHFSNVGGYSEEQQFYDRRISASAPDGAGSGIGVAVCGSGLSQLVNAQSKIDSLKTWGVSAYKCTRQAISERLGKVTRTVDAELEQNITTLRDLQTQYDHLLTLARSLLSHFHQVQTSQQSISECLTDFAKLEPDLRDEFLKNAETQKIIAGNGLALEAALNFFISTLATLCQKTIEDTMLTVRNYETARLEYDAYRYDYEAIQQSPVRGSDHQGRLMEAEHALLQQKQRYEQLRDDVQVKMRFLHENKVKVMKKQLLLLHNATSAYFGGNQKSLEAALQQFNLKPVSSSTNSSSSWLEA